MKISDLLDDIFFRKGNKDFLPIASKFAGNDEAEIFGISENLITEKTRVLATMPETAEKGSKLNLFLGDSSGEVVQICNETLTREQVLTLYALIMSDYDRMRNISNSNLETAAKLVKYLVIALPTEEEINQKG